MKYTVLLLYPDYLNSSNDLHQTYLAHVTARNPIDAVVFAKEDMFEANHWSTADDDPEDFFVLSVFEGHLDDLKEST